MEKKEGKLYTGTGDKGLTSLLPGSQVPKADERVAAIGGCEESVAALGSVRAVTDCPIFTGKLTRVQKTLRTLAAGLADPRSGRYVFSAEEVAFLESDMDKMLEKLPETTHKEALSETLPGGCEQSARLDVARATVRRAERALISMDRRYAVPATFKQYINRLGDWLLVCARYSDFLHEQKKAETQATVPAGVTAVPETLPHAAPTIVPAVVPHVGTAATSGTAPTASMEDLVGQVLARLGAGKALDLPKATRLMEAIEQKARADGKQAVIAVVNAEGNPVAVHCMDGAFLVSYEVAVKKAYTAVAVKMPTMELSRLVQPGQTFYGLQNLDKIVTFGGGVPLTVGGVIVGGLGVSGGTGEEDHALAVYGASVFPAL